MLSPVSTKMGDRLRLYYPGSACTCLWSCTDSSLPRYLINRLWEFHQIYNFGAVGDKDERIRFGDGQIQDQCLSETKHTFPAEAYPSVVHHWRPSSYFRNPVYSAFAYVHLYRLCYSAELMKHHHNTFMAVYAYLLAYFLCYGLLVLLLT